MSAISFEKSYSPSALLIITVTRKITGMTVTIKRGEVFCFSLEFEKTLGFLNLFCTEQHLDVWSVPLLAVYVSCQK